MTAKTELASRIFAACMLAASLAWSSGTPAYAEQTAPVVAAPPVQQQPPVAAVKAAPPVKKATTTAVTAPVTAVDPTAKPVVKKIAAVSPCKGLDDKSCGTNKACSWVIPKDPNDKTGKVQAPYCRAVAAVKKPTAKPATAKANVPETLPWAAKSQTATATAPPVVPAKTAAKVAIQKPVQKKVAAPVVAAPVSPPAETSEPASPPEPAQ